MCSRWTGARTRRMPARTANPHCEKLGIDEMGKRRIEQLKEANANLYTGYLLKEQVFTFCGFESRADAETYLDEWASSCVKSNSEAFRRTGQEAQTAQGFHPGILRLQDLQRLCRGDQQQGQGDKANDLPGISPISGSRCSPRLENSPLCPGTSNQMPLDLSPTQFGEEPAV